ncbi:MAG: glycosyltransferase, partial [Nanoarchaeota archaeon]|nr:glycosyltransferase [Nanoarchaeota archaeon]
MAKRSLPKVAIIILTYSQDKLLELCIRSIRKTAGYGEYQIFLVDNNSKNKIGGKIKKKFSGVKTIINKENYGFSKGNNIGIDIARKEYKPDYFLVLNDDTEFFQKDWLKKLVSISERENFGVAGCKLVYPDKSVQNAGGFLEGWKITKIMAIGKKEVKKVDHIMGAFMFVKREVMDKLRGFNEDYSPY